MQQKPLINVRFIANPPNAEFEKGDIVYLSEDQVELLKDYVQIVERTSVYVPFDYTKGELDVI